MIDGYNAGKQGYPKVYQQVQTQAADEKQLLVLLFDGATRLLRDGRRFLVAHKYEQWAECSNRVRRILSELILALDEGAAPELCGSLKALYVYVQRLITEGGLEEDTDKLEEAIELLQQLGSAWKEARLTCSSQRTQNAA
jgi:flagellar secretion chaperone FliS